MDHELFVKEETSFALPIMEVDQGLSSGKLEQVMAYRSLEPLDEGMVDAARQLLVGVGEDVDREGLVKTPARIARMLREVTSGYDVDLDEVINGAIFQEEYAQPVVVKDIQYYSMCEHHLLPFHGNAHVAYLPQGKVVGLSKIPRVVETFARRLQVQERLTDQIADFLVEKLDPLGVAVVLEGTHFCAVMRGVSQPTGKMKTRSLRGLYQQEPSQLAELFS